MQRVNVENNDVVIPLLDEESLVPWEPREWWKEMAEEPRLRSFLIKFNIIKWQERGKYLPLGAGVAVGLVFLSLATYVLKKRMSLVSRDADYFLTAYNGTFSARVNDTCGHYYPINSVCDFNAYLTNNSGWYCAKAAESLDWLNDSWKMFNRVRGNLTCAQRYNYTNDFCNWHQIIGCAFDCVVGMTDLCGVYYAELLYVDRSLRSICDIRPLSGTTCNDIVPLQELCDNQLWLTPPFRCANYASILCASNYAAKLAAYQGIIPGTNNSCVDLFPSLQYSEWPSMIGNVTDCYYASQQFCTSYSSIQRYGDLTYKDKRDVLLNYLGLFLGLAALFILIGLVITNCATPKRKLNELPAEDTGPLLALSAELLLPIENDKAIADATDILSAHVKVLSDKKEKLRAIPINQALFLSAARPKNQGTRLHHFLNNGGKQLCPLIFFYAGFRETKPEIKRPEIKHSAIKRVALLRSYEVPNCSFIKH